MLDDVAVREAFHVHLLRDLVRSMDPHLFRLKGGVNLRLYFGSLRYSEDIDLDADRGARPILRREIGRLLHDAAFLRQLATLGIRGVDGRTAPNKDTETTLRYKARVVSPGGVPLPTKVDVSFRQEESAEEGTLEAADERVTSQYLSSADRPLQVMHYTVMPAVRQKIAALALRAEVQARDVFDLAMLAEKRTDTLDLPFLRRRLSDDTLREAHRRALSLPYDVYRSTVVEFLDPSERATLGSDRSWDEQRLFAARLIEGIQRDVQQ
jgi:predicted nucleotidyltransferase component of viral defense system